MNLEFLRQRMIRILTRPPELLQALTGRWLSLLLCLAFGTFVGVALAVLTPVEYEARAVLHVSSENPLDELNPPQLGFPGRLQNPFIATQSRLLVSEPVLREALEVLVADSPQIANEHRFLDIDPNRLPDFLEFLRPLATEVSRLFSDDIRQGDGLDRERILQRAVAAFLRRCEVTIASSDPAFAQDSADSNEIQLALRGVDRGRLREEITRWINAYRDKVEELAELRKEAKVATRVRAEEKVVAAAKQALDDFETANPGLSEEQLVDKRRDMDRLRLEIEEIDRKLVAPLPEGTPTPDELLLRSYDERIRLMLTVENRGPDSKEVEDFRRRYDALKIKIDEAVKSRESEHEREKAEHAARIPVLREALENEYVAVAKLTRALETRTMLRTRYSDALGRLKDEESRGTKVLGTRVLVDVVGPPVVTTDPTKYQPLKRVALGVAAGVLLALFVCVLLETLCGKVRNKHDLVADFGLPVVAVFPR